MNLYAIGCDQFSFRNALNLLNLKNFKKVILTDDVKHSRYFDIKLALPISDFIYEVIKSQEDITLISFYDFSVGHLFISYLHKKLPKIKIIDWYSFALQHNLPILYMPAVEERDCFIKNKVRYKALSSQFTDDLSKITIDTMMEAYETKNKFLLTSVYVDTEMEFCNRISDYSSIKPDDDEIFVDVGAWDGDTVIKFCDIVNGKYKAIHAFEPIISKYKILNSKKKYIPNLYTYNLLLSDIDGELTFDENSGMRSQIACNFQSKYSKKKCFKLDTLLTECSFVKLDVEGHEDKVLRGMQRIIRDFHPKLSIDVHHYPEDIFKCFEEVSKHHNYKNITFRLHFPDFHGGVMYFYD